MKKYSSVVIVTAIIFICFSVAIFVNIISLSDLINENAAEKSTVIADEIYHEIHNTIEKAMAVSKTVDNSLVCELIDNKGNYTQQELSDSFGTYLNELKRNFDYGTAFLVADSTKAYYTEWGFVKYLDTEGEDDSWFENFKKSGKAVELNIDNDQANDNRITVYTNYRIDDTEGNFKGVCGVGIVLDELEETMREMEAQYDMRVRLVSSKGIIQVTTLPEEAQQPISDVEKELIASMSSVGQLVLEDEDAVNFRMLRYVSECDWYMVAEFTNDYDDFTRVISRNLVICIVAIIFIVIIISMVIKTDDDKALAFKSASETDRMTGLSNRSAFEADIEKIEHEGNAGKLTALVIDINGLKNANDEHGHNAGDELIIGAGSIISRITADLGTTYRIGGDEFAVLILNPVDDVRELLKSIRDEAAAWHGESIDTLALAVGVARAEDYPEKTINELIKLADEGMYRDKEEYYRDARHNRRAARR